MILAIWANRPLQNGQRGGSLFRNGPDAIGSKTEQEADSYERLVRHGT
jgi:hypothetical protein